MGPRLEYAVTLQTHFLPMLLFFLKSMDQPVPFLEEHKKACIKDKIIMPRIKIFANPPSPPFDTYIIHRS